MDEYHKGYEEEMAWLQGKTLDEARHALSARLATADDSTYNQGGTQATRDYIRRLEAQ